MGGGREGQRAAVSERWEGSFKWEEGGRDRGWL